MQTVVTFDFEKKLEQAAQEWDQPGHRPDQAQRAADREDRVTLDRVHRRQRSAAGGYDLDLLSLLAQAAVAAVVRTFPAES